MSKFKVGDKVWCNGSIETVKKIEEFLDGSYVYYFHEDSDALGYWEEYDLELYKTPHERLIELGWFLFSTIGKVYTYKLEGIANLYPEIIELSLEGKRYYTTLKVVNLELAEILVDYLKELQDE